VCVCVYFLSWFSNCLPACQHCHSVGDSKLMMYTNSDLKHNRSAVLLIHCLDYLSKVNHIPYLTVVTFKVPAGSCFLQVKF